MTAKTILEAANPVTQSIDGVRALLSWRGHPVNPMPADVSLDNGRMVLVLNGKRDAYYCTTSTKCSCPAAHWNRGPCKHMRRYFPQQETAKPVSAANDSIKPVAKWAGGRNGPVDDDLKVVA